MYFNRVQYKVGDIVYHKKYGKGIVAHIFLPKHKYAIVFDNENKSLDKFYGLGDPSYEGRRLLITRGLFGLTLM